MRAALAVSLLVASAAAFPADWPQRIEIFISAPVKVTGISTARARGAVVEVLDVSAVAILESRLSNNLPAVKGLAEREGRKRLRAVTAKEKSKALDGVRARYRAAGYGIDIFPSIVIDGMYIVGNTTSIGDAVRRWRRIAGP